MPGRSLANLFPGPREVALAGRVFLVGEFTLGDCAEAEAPREARRPDPLAALGGLLWADAIAPEDRGRFREALDLAYADDDGGTPATDAEWAAEWLSFLRVALRRHHPEVAKDDEALWPILANMRAGEFASLRAAAYRTDPVTVLCRALDRFCGTAADDEAEETDWFALVDHVSRSHGLSYEVIRGMTRTQFLNALAEGKTNDGRDARPGEDAVGTHSAWTRWLAEDDTDRKGAG